MRNFVWVKQNVLGIIWMKRGLVVQIITNLANVHTVISMTMVDEKCRLAQVKWDETNLSLPFKLVQFFSYTSHPSIVINTYQCLGTLSTVPIRKYPWCFDCLFLIFVGELSSRSNIRLSRYSEYCALIGWRTMMPLSDWLLYLSTVGTQDQEDLGMASRLTFNCVI